LKSTKQIVASLTLIALITGCTQLNTSQEKFVVFASHENMNHELRESLLKCLNTLEIRYQLDKDENVLIMKKDSDHAISRCS
jgi:hypothetical protein